MCARHILLILTCAAHKLQEFVCLSSFYSFRDLSIHTDGQADEYDWFDSASDPEQEYFIWS